MGKRATVKDIAKHAGVSLGAVHYALSGKRGVSEQTRERILNIARQIDYRPNSGAAALKRKPVTIAAVFPGAAEDSRFFFEDVWQGLRASFYNARDLNINYIEAPYYPELNNNADELTAFLDETEIDGLLSVGFTDNRGMLPVQRIIDRNIPVAFVSNDLPLASRLLCVQPDYRVTGRMLAEFISRQIPPGAGVLIYVGDELMPSHYLMVEGFDSYLADKGLKNPVYKVHAENDKAETVKRLIQILQKEPVAACTCVNARGSVLLANALIETGLAGKVIAVGSDLFEENFRFLRDGVFTNLLNKNSFFQGYIAAMSVIDYLVRDKKPPDDNIYVRSEIVFQSNAEMYQDGSSRMFL
jgi:LacI family transcriptional regulator